MATLTTTDIRPALRNVAIASLLDDMRPARSTSSPATMSYQPGLRTSTRREAAQSHPDDRHSSTQTNTNKFLDKTLRD